MVCFWGLWWIEDADDDTRGARTLTPSHTHFLSLSYPPAEVHLPLGEPPEGRPRPRPPGLHAALGLRGGARDDHRPVLRDESKTYFFLSK